MLVVSKEHLDAAIEAAVWKVFSGMYGKKEEEKEPELLTEPEVRRMLNVAHSTIWSYGKTGYLPVVKIGGKNYWRKSDVLKIMGA